MAPSPGARRAFLAIDLDEPTRDLLAAHLRAHVAELPGKAVPPRNWHLTLRFLGTATDLQLDRVLADLSMSSLPGPTRLRFTGLGAFPRAARAAVLWLGVDADEGLDDLAAACEEAAVGAGFDPEGRPFHPHLTLARVRPPEDVRPLLARVPPFVHSMAVDTLTLFESHLGRGAAVYEPIERIEL